MDIDVNMTAVWLLVGLLLGWLFRGVIKSAFSDVFNNPILQNPPSHWKGIDQNLFENPSFKMRPPARSCNCGGTTANKEGMCGCMVNGMYDWRSYGKNNW